MSKLKMKRFPGDTIVVPMLIGVVLNSFVPQVLQIGGFFTGMGTGTSALGGVFLLFMGATIDIKTTPSIRALYPSMTTMPSRALLPSLR